MTSAYLPAAGSGTLLVASAGQLVASIVLIGTYSAGNFHISSGISGSVKITDPGIVNGGSVPFGDVEVFPHHGVDLPHIANGAQTTLANSEKRAETGGPLALTDDRHGASVVLFRNYMAASFVAPADANGVTLTTNLRQADHPLPLTVPLA